jgi:zinc protease
VDRIRKTALAGDAVAITEEQHVSPVLALRLYVRTGSLFETPAEAGLAHFLEHLVFRGTARRPGGRVVEEIESLGGEINAWTSYEATSFHALVGSRHLDTALDVLTDMVALPSLPADTFETERAVVVEEIRKGVEQPDQALEERLLELAFDGHALARPICGTTASVGACRREQARAFHEEQYRTGNVVLVAVGDLDADRFLRRAEDLLKSFPQGRSPRGLAPLPPPAGFAADVLIRDVEEDRFGLGFRIPGARDERSLLSELLATLMGGSENSIGYRELVRDRDLFNDVQASTLCQTPGGLLIVQGWAGHDRPALRLRELLRRLASLADHPLDRALLDRTVRRIANDRVFQRETVEGEAARLGSGECTAFDPELDVRDIERLRSITPDDLSELAAEILTPENLALAVVTPEGSEVARLVRSGDAEGLVREALGPRRARRRQRPTAPAVTIVEAVPGVTLVLRPDPTIPIVSAVAAMPGGTRLETPETAGLSSFLADALTRGTTRFPAQALLDLQEEIGGSLNPFAGRNSLGLQADFLSEHAALGLDLFFDVLFRPRFPKAGLEITRRLQLEDLKGLQDTPLELGTDLLFALAFPGHPYALPSLGTEASIGAVTREALAAHHARHVARGNVVLALVGDLDPDQVIKRLARVTVDLPVPLRDTLAPLPCPSLERPARQVVPRPERKTELLFGFPGVAVRDPGRYAVEVLTLLLAGQSGRLFAKLREETGGVYDVDAVSWEGLDAGLLIVSFATSPERVGSCVDLFHAEVRRLLEGGVTQAELERAKQALVGGFEISFQRRGTVAYHLAYDVAYGLGPETAARYGERVYAVTRADVEAAARRTLGAPGVAEVVLAGAASAG